MKRVFRASVLKIFLFAILAFCFFSCAYWFSKLPQPSLDHISQDKLRDDWRSDEKPLFPPQTNWGDFEYHIILSSRLKWEAKYEGYEGGGQLSNLAQDIPFLVFFIKCQLTNDENSYTNLQHLYEEKYILVDDSIEALLLFDSLDNDSLSNIEARAGKGNYIEINALFSYQKYSYHIHGIFPMSGSEFSMSDTSVMKVREIVIKYMNDMVLSAP